MRESDTVVHSLVTATTCSRGAARIRPGAGRRPTTDSYARPSRRVMTWTTRDERHAGARRDPCGRAGRAEPAATLIDHALSTRVAVVTAYPMSVVRGTVRSGATTSSEKLPPISAPTRFVTAIQSKTENPREEPGGIECRGRDRADHRPHRQTMPQFASSSANATPSSVASSPIFAERCAPIGTPSMLVPAGTAMAGPPLTLFSGVKAT
jgi:hypothetical protein